MENRYQSAEDVNDLDELDMLVYQSRLIGEEPSLVLWGGGNTSLKVARVDFRGSRVKAMLVKGSGSDMKSALRRDFPALRMDDILPLFELSQMSDDGMMDYLSHCAMDPGSPRPSIETLLHGFLPQNSVVHTHADAILSLTNTRNSHKVLAQVFGSDCHSVGLPAAGLSPRQRGGYRCFEATRSQGLGAAQPWPDHLGSHSPGQLPGPRGAG